MKQKLLKLLGILGSLALIALVISCNPNPSAEDVTLDQIGRHTGTTYSSEADAASDLEEATTQTGDGVAEAESTATTKSMFIDKQVELMANSAVERVQSMVSPKTVTVEYDTTSGGYMASMTIDDHTINGDGSGTMYIPNYYVELSLTGDSNRAEAKTWTEGSIEFTDYNDGVRDVVIEDGLINVGGRSTVVAEYTADYSDILISFDIYLAYKMGFALYNPVTGNGGRVIINMEYEYNLPPTSYSTFSTTAWSTDTFGDATATLTVYNNSGAEVLTKTYTGSEIYDLASDIDLSGSYVE